jgi:hypothetical protein
VGCTFFQGKGGAVVYGKESRIGSKWGMCNKGKEKGKEKRSEWGVNRRDRSKGVLFVVRVVW